MRRFFTMACALAVAVTAIEFLPTLREAHASTPAIAPQFTHQDPAQWLNTQPLSLASLKGKVVLVEFWAFDCVNCRRTVAWMHSVQEKYATQKFQIVAVHTPELPQERATNNVLAAIAQQHITYPVMLDADYSYWKALNNQYWPAFYVIDADGNIAAQAIGEMHVGDARAVEFERRIDALLARAH